MTCKIGNACRCVSEPQLCPNWEEVMTDDDKLLALAQKATPGPWWWLDREKNGERYLEGRGNSILTCGGMPGRVNADWIVAANPSAIIALIERHRAEVEQLTGEVIGWRAEEFAARDRAESAEAALAAAQKRVGVLDAALEKIVGLGDVNADEAPQMARAALAESGTTS